MVQLVSLTEVKHMLKIDGDDDDATLLLLIGAASGAVINYLKSSADQYLGEDGEVLPGAVVPPEIKTATAVLVGQLMRNPDNDVEGAFERGYLPRTVTSLLYPLRDPACA